MTSSGVVRRIIGVFIRQDSTSRGIGMHLRGGTKDSQYSTTCVYDYLCERQVQPTTMGLTLLYIIREEERWSLSKGGGARTRQGGTGGQTF